VRRPTQLDLLTLTLTIVGVGVGVGVGAGCSDRDRPEVRRDVARQHRFIEPPSGTVRSLAPYAIRAEGVGPYLLGAPLASLLDPAAPRIALFDIPPVVQVSLVRAEDGGVLIGGDPVGPATFVAVLRREVGATDSGVHVGSSRDELMRALGPLDAALDRAYDPRVLAPSGLRGARAVVDGDRVVALVLGAGEADARDPASGRRPHPTEVAPPPHGHPAASRDAGSVVPPPSPPAEGCVRPIPSAPASEHAVRFGACLSAGGEIIEISGDEISIRASEAERPTASAHVPGLVFAAALRPDPGEAWARDELVVVSRVDEPTLRSWAVAVYRFEPPPRAPPGRPLVLTKIADQIVYQLSTDKTRWIGADLREVELYLELVARPDAIEVSGLLTTRTGDRIRDLAVISPISVTRRRGRSGSSEVVDAGVGEPERPDGGSAGDGGHPEP
jgi:hypothetical protein